MLTAPVLAQDETSAVQTQTQTQEQNIKTVPFKSFFSKFKKKKKEETKEIPVVNEVPLYEAKLVYNVDDCIKIGLKNSPYVKNLINTKNAQKHEVNSAKSNYFPVITGGTGYSYGYTHNSGGSASRGRTTRNGYGLDIGLSTMVFDFGRTIAKINMHKFNYESAGYDLDDGVLNTVYDIKLAYTRVLEKRARMSVLAQNVKLNELNVERTNAMYDVGLKSKIDLVNAEANLTTSQIALVDAEKAYQLALIDLNSVMYYMNAPVYSITPTETFNFKEGIELKNEVNVSFNQPSKENENLTIKEGAIFSGGVERKCCVEGYDFRPFELTLKQVMDKAFADRFDLKSMKLVKRAAEESLKAVKRSYYPELNVSASYGLGVNANNVMNTTGVDSGNVSNSVSLYGGLDLPAINAMYIKNQIDIAKINVDKAINNISQLENNIYFEVQNLYVSMKQYEQKIPLMKNNVAQFKENFELADGRYSVGLGNFIELQEALTDYNNAQLSFIESVFLYNESLIELERAMAVVYEQK